MTRWHWELAPAHVMPVQDPIRSKMDTAPHKTGLVVMLILSQKEV